MDTFDVPPAFKVLSDRLQIIFEFTPETQLISTVSCAFGIPTKLLFKEHSKIFIPQGKRVVSGQFTGGVPNVRFPLNHLPIEV